MRKIGKRIMAYVLAILILCMSTGILDLPVSAASPTGNITWWRASTATTGVISEFGNTYDGHIFYTMIDNHSAYCMNHSLAANNGQLMTSDTTPRTAMSAEQQKLMAYCMYYGFTGTETTEPNADMKSAYIATQAMVWIIERGIYGTGAAASAAAKICAVAPNVGNANTFYNNLKMEIDRSYYATRPSFATASGSGAPTYTLKWNPNRAQYETTLTDTNNALGSYNVSLPGYSVSKSGNQLTIVSKNVNTATTGATMSSAAGAVQATSNCVFWLTGKAGYQEFISEKPTVDAVRAYFNVKTEAVGYAKLTKTDTADGRALSGAVYGFYSDSSCKNLVDSVTTGSDGSVTRAIGAGTYYVKEITAPNRYVRSNQVQTVVITANQTTPVNVSDEEQMGAITIFKEGEVLTGWNGTNFVYQTAKLKGATFRVTAGADIYKADGTKVYDSGTVIAETLTTGDDGQAVLTNLNLGVYVVTETSSISGYTINKNPKTVTIAYKDQNVSVQYESTTITNTRQKAEVSVQKKDSDTENPLVGGKFTIYAASDIQNNSGQTIVTKDAALQTVATGADGKASFQLDLPIDYSYYVKETQAPYAYTRNQTDIYSFDFVAMDEEQSSATFSHTFTNNRTTAKIHLKKVDKETGAVPQGDAMLSGAVYGLYARNDIVHPDGATGILFHAGDLVETLTTDESGQAEVQNLYLGNYYVKEITPSEGYLIDESEYDVAFEYEGDLVAEVSRSTTSEEQVIKQPFQLIKVSDDGEDTESKTLEGVEFTVYLKSSLVTGEDGSIDYDATTPVVVGADGETVLISDENGYAVSIAIPYGTYVVRETKTPHNLTPIKPFEVKIVENHPTEPQNWRVFLDREFSAKLRVVKKDGDTKKTVLLPNATFKIYNIDKKTYVKQYTTYPSKQKHTSFATDADGDLILPEKLQIGNYRIEEIAAPYGYALNDDFVEVAIDSDTAYEMDDDTNDVIITVDYVDAPVVGKLTIKKRGEVLKNYTGFLFASSVNKKFVYKEVGLAGAKYDVYAAEDIYTADYQLDADGTRTKYYTKGQYVTTLVTDEDGVAVAENLPLGTYQVMEVEAPYGYVRDQETKTVAFQYVDDKTPVIEETLSLTNARQKVKLSVVKVDSKTGAKLAGATFNLYADADIVNAEDKLIVEKGTLLETATSDSNGVVSFTKDYPFGKYVVKEQKAPDGYQLSTAQIQFDAKYTTQNEATTSYSETFKNTAIPVTETPSQPTTSTPTTPQPTTSKATATRIRTQTPRASSSKVVRISGKVPKTGDVAYGWIGFAISMLILGVGMMYFGKKYLKK